MVDLVFGWPQIILSALIIVKMISNVSSVGKQYATSDTGNRAAMCFGVVTHPFLWFGLLYLGGFFTA